ncbi:MAG TPA: PIG-L family deacetylase [Vicinamibacteria bacterium]|nr:PIG-L family deacetylase [Vicinamibacteria bacterium]
MSASLRRSATRAAKPATLAAAMFLLLTPSAIEAQLAPLPMDRGGVGLGLALRRLPVTGRVLLVTAHPDDEPSGLLVRLARGLGLRTAQLSLTRGEGGQNEIGSELGEALGVLRTEELLGSHRYAGAEVYFGRCYEFGYSFSVDETYERWGQDAALSDVVRVVRAFRPDVILTLPLEAPGGGQHHQAAARLARDAFRAAADPARFPEQVRSGLLPWQARKIYQGGFGPLPAALTIRTGVYDPLLGMSWQELGSIARAHHRCQGASQLKADPLSGETHFALLDSEPPVPGVESDVLDGVDVSLERLAIGAAAADVEQLRTQVDAAQAAYDPRDPGRTAAPLAAALDVVRKLRAKLPRGALPEAARFDLLDRLAQKERELLGALALSQGLELEVTADDGEVVPGQSFGVSARVFNQGAALVRVDDVTLLAPDGWRVRRSAGEARTLETGRGLEIQFQVRVGDRVRYAKPYWHRSAPTLWRYDVLDSPAFETLPFAPPELTAALRYTAAGGVSAALEEPVVFRYEGRWVGGEKQKTVRSVPLLSLAITPEIAVFPAGARPPKREFKIAVRNQGREAQAASVRLEAPAGWSVEPAQASVALRFEDEEAHVRFQVSPPAGAQGEAVLRAVAATRDAEFREGFERVAYDHIQERNVYALAQARVKGLDVKAPTGVSVGYVMGAGDEVANAIFQLGVPVTFVTEAGLSSGDLSRYTTIVTGIRAYQTRPDLRAFHQRVMKWVSEGGHLVVQYNKLDFNQLQERPEAGGFSGQRAENSRPPDSPWAPYPGASVSTNRVTDESAPVTFLVPDHPLLSTPNRLAARDFEGWVQERGTYFLDARDVRYKELLASSDPFPLNPGEKRGMLVEAQVGKGTWTYVGLGLFRQVAAGVDGAYRILANLVARPRAR